MGKYLETLKRWNLWEREIDTGRKREDYLEKIVPYLERKEILVLKGLRRSGKSTILKQLMYELLAKGVDKKQILYLNLEDFTFANNLMNTLFDEVFKEYQEYTKNKKRVYYIIDEIQKIKSWEQWIRTQYDLNEDIKFIVTGSSAALLSQELSTLLTGRNITFTIMPLSFKEYLSFNKNGTKEEYMLYGGFPEVVLERSEEKKKTLLQQYFDDIIHKDIIDRYTIRNTKQIIDLARYLIATSGAKVSSNKLSRVFGIAKDTLQVYINYMADAFLLKEVPYFSFSIKVRHDRSKLPKFYCLDLGLVNIASQTYTKNVGQKFENAVFIKLFQEYKEVCYWCSNNAEVDFIVDRIAINVTASDQIPEREWEGLKEFQKKNKGFTGIVVAPTGKDEHVYSVEEFLKKHRKP